MLIPQTNCTENVRPKFKSVLATGTYFLFWFDVVTILNYTFIDNKMVGVCITRNGKSKFKTIGKKIPLFDILLGHIEKPITILCAYGALSVSPLSYGRQTHIHTRTHPCTPNFINKFKSIMYFACSSRFQSQRMWFKWMYKQYTHAGTNSVWIVFNIRYELRV